MPGAIRLGSQFQRAAVAHVLGAFLICPVVLFSDCIPFVKEGRSQALGTGGAKRRFGAARPAWVGRTASGAWIEKVPPGQKGR